jgi:hypothetical protein
MNKVLHASTKQSAHANTAKVVMKTAAIKPIAHSNVIRSKSQEGIYGKNTFGGGSAELKALSIVSSKQHLPSSAIANNSNSIPKATTAVANANFSHGLAATKTFKARPMPNFKRVNVKTTVASTKHVNALKPTGDLVEIPTAKVSNKENNDSVIANEPSVKIATGVTQRKPMANMNRFSMMNISNTPNASDNNKRMSSKVLHGSSAIVDKNRANRQSMFVASSKDSRAQQLASKRQLA